MFCFSWLSHTRVKGYMYNGWYNRVHFLTELDDDVIVFFSRNAILLICYFLWDFQELFEGYYFCQAQREDFFQRAKPYKEHPTILR